jgi:hypothetical protein
MAHIRTSYWSQPKRVLNLHFIVALWLFETHFDVKHAVRRAENTSSQDRHLND